ncbi:flagellar motor stator protein MotA [Gallaecimonas mangrovi]|uniref:flagellar motor stator protein MotA n=1 Tax=Gallaecimonas mangrovi TaxID=2291597 RepID=UPI000E208680|nr:flagellar motor stator protein MotA [Gallaecimonas mangrovi]
MQKLIGIAVVALCVFGGFVMAQGKLVALWQPSEMIIILGAALGSMVLGNSMVVLKEVGIQVKGILSVRKGEAELARELLMLMHLLLDEIRQKGLKVLDEHIEAPQESPWFQRYPEVLKEAILVNFITDNLRMLAMGKISAHEFEAVLEQEILAIEDDMLKASKALHRTGEAMPGFGILAAVGGIIITMQHLDGPLADIGVHVASALVGTFIGIFGCYCLFEPTGAAMAELVHRKVSLLECVKAVLTSHVAGKAPMLAVDAGRRVLEMDVKPSFSTLEKWLDSEAL